MSIDRANCLTDEVIRALMDQRLEEVGLGAVARHIDACPACRRIVAEIARAADADGRAVRSDSAPSAAGATTPTPEYLASGTAVGRYVVLELIGTGAMGAVYRARDPELGRRVALKLVRPERHQRGSTNPQARLLREAQAIARVSHPNVIAIYDVGTCGNAVFLAMELVEGGTLRDWLRGARRSWREVLEMFRRAGAGLAAAHAAGLVHRDFKPDNVLVGADGRVRVTDFGLARAATDPHRDTESDDAPPQSLAAAMTETGAIVGTLAYMAPEQMAHGVADASSDLFSFCVAFYEALYGERPFAGGTATELYGAASHGRIQLAARGARVPAWLRRSVLRGLCADRCDRPAGVTALLADIDRRQRRHRGMLLAATAGALLTVTGLVALDVREDASTAAAEAYATATELWRTDSVVAGEAGWREALRLDPGFCEAHVRLLVESAQGVFGSDTQLRPNEHLEMARRCRRRLTPAFQAMLEAATHKFSHPPEELRFIERAGRAADQFPQDADLAWLAGVALVRSDPSRAIAFLDRGLAVDSRYMLLYITKAFALDALGRQSAATEAIDACLRALPESSACSYHRFIRLFLEGSCAQADALARRFLALRPGAGTGQQMLFESLIAAGAPAEAVEEAHRRARELPGGADEDDRLVMLAATYGDFEGVLARVAQLDAAEASRSDESRRWLLAELKIEALLEQGDAAGARVALDAFLRRRPALTTPKLANERRQLRLAVQMQLAPPARLAAVIESDLIARPPAGRFDRWVRAYVFDDPTVEQARAAVAAVPSEAMPSDPAHPIDGALPGSYEHVDAVLRVGLTLHRGGRPSEAIRWLAAGIRPCMSSFANPYRRLRGALALGEARAARGDLAGARAAYQEVVKYWGSARKRSVTAEAAKARLAARAAALVPGPERLDTGTP